MQIAHYNRSIYEHDDQTDLTHRDSAEENKISNSQFIRFGSCGAERVVERMVKGVVKRVMTK